MPAGLKVPTSCSQVVLDFSLILFVADTHWHSIIHILSLSTLFLFFVSPTGSSLEFSVYSKYIQQQQLRRHWLCRINVPTHLQSFIIAVGLQFSDVLKLVDNCCWWKCFIPIIKKQNKQEKHNRQTWLY